MISKKNYRKADWIAEVIPDPKEYNEEGVRGLIDNLLLSYEIVDESI